MDTTKELFGLTDKEMEIYKFLLKNSNKNSSEISKGLSMQRPNTYDLLNTLLSKGLVSFSIDGRVKKYFAVHPKKLKDIYEYNKLVFNQKEKEVDSLVKNLISSFSLDSSDLNIQFYNGVKGMRTVLMDAIEESRKTKKEMLAIRLNSDDLPELDKTYTERFFILRKKYNLKSRYLRLKDTKFFDDSLVSSRMLDEKYSSSTGWFVYGNKVSIWLFPKKGLIINIENKDIADAMRSYFAVMWEKSG